MYLFLFLVEGSWEKVLQCATALSSGVDTHLWRERSKPPHLISLFCFAVMYTVDDQLVLGGTVEKNLLPWVFQKNCSLQCL